MTNNEYLEMFYLSKKGNQAKQPDEKEVFEVAELISGSFIYSLYENLLQSDAEMDMIAEHLEHLYDTANHYGLVYFIIMLAEAVGVDLPREYVAMSLNADYIPVLSAAIIEDWLDIEE